MPPPSARTARTARRAWHLYRAGRNLPATLAALGWARLHGVHGVLGPDLLVECAPMPPGSYGRGGTTVGNAWLHGGLGGPARRRHESRHADQYALLGTGAFLALYGLNALLTRNEPHRNLFERWAGLADGGYAPASGTAPGTAPRSTTARTTTGSGASAAAGRTRTARTATSSSA